MANDGTANVLLRFSGDARGAKDANAQVRAETSKTAQGQVQTAKDANKQVANEARSQTKTLEKEERERLRAAESLQRQKSAALIAIWKREAQERARLSREADKASQSTTSSLTGSLSSLGGGGAIIGRLTSQLGSYTSAAGGAASSTAALAGPIGIAVAAFTAEVAIVATLTSNLFDLAKTTADYQGKLVDLSQQVNVSVETLGTLDALARSTGGNIDTVTGSLAIFQKNLEAAKDPTSDEAELLRELNVTSRDTEVALGQALAGLFALGEGSEQTAKSLELFGRSGRFFNAILKESNGNIEEAKRRYLELGGVTRQQAELADKFNDQLVVLGVQVASLGQETIPLFLDLLRDLSKLLADNRDLVKFLTGAIGGLAASITIPLRIALIGLRGHLEAVRPVLYLIAAAFKQIKEAIEFISGHPINISTSAAEAKTGTTTATPSGEAGPLGGREDINKEIEQRRELARALGFDFDESRRRSEARLAQTKREFEEGQATRAQLLAATIDLAKKKAAVDIDALERERFTKSEELKLITDNQKKRDQAMTQILAIDSRILDKKDELSREIADLQAKSNREELRRQAEHERFKAEQLIALGDERIKVIEEEIKAELTTREDGLAKIEEIEKQSLRVKGDLLKKELTLAGVGPDRQAVLDKITALNAERERVDREAAERRRRFEKEENDRSILEARRGVELRDAQREGELNRLQFFKERGHITESIFIGKQQQLLTAAHNDRIKLIEQELALETTSAARKRELLAEKAKAEQEYTDNFKLLSAQRLAALAAEAAANIPSPGGPVKTGGSIPIDIGEPPEQTLAALVGLAVEAGDVFDGLGTAIQGSLGLATETAKTFGNLIADTFGEVANAVGAAVRSFVLFGTVQGGFKRFAAEVIASVAAMSAVQAVFQFAQGVAWSALFWFTGNPRYAKAASEAFISAAVFGSIAGVAALAGRAVAGNSFNQDAGGGGGGGGGSSNTTGPAPGQQGQPQPVNLNRNNAAGAPIVIKIDITRDEGSIVDAVVKNARNNGEIRDMVKRESKR